MIDRLRTLYYQTLYQYVLGKVRFGNNIRIRCRLRVQGPGKIYIGSDCLFEPDPWGNDFVTLFTHRPEAEIHIGNRVTLRATRFGSHLKIIIEDGAVLENVSVFDSDFHNIDASQRDENFNDGDREVFIGRNCYIGCESLVSKGTILQKDVILLPGSVIGTKKVHGGLILSGNPARKISSIPGPPF